MKYTFLLTVSAIFFATQLMAQNQFPAFPPDDVSAKTDYEQMLWQMNIVLPELPLPMDDKNLPVGATLADSTKPNGNVMYKGMRIIRSPWGLWTNYDDYSTGLFPAADSNLVWHYEPISLLKMHNGKNVKNAKEWQTKRRPEIAHDVQQYLYGFQPVTKMPAVNFKVKKNDTLDNCLQYEITGDIDVSQYPQVRNKPVIKATLRVPKSDKPVPVMIIFGWGNPLDRYWEIMSKQGWGVCIFSPNAIQPDNGAGLTSYLLGLVNKGNWRKPTDWGSIGAWSWGISRLIDCFETIDGVNSKAIGLMGHSRYGKATLFTAAFEPRIAIAFPSDAGSLGTKTNRRHWGQDVEISASASEYHWLAGAFMQWCGEEIPGQYLPRKVGKMPVDAHSLLALCAPRPVFLNGGDDSKWIDPYGVYLTGKNASPAYELLGVRGLIMNDPKPIIDKAYIDGTIAYRCHTGGHTDLPDWDAFFEFAKKFIKN
ncbi:MAG: hypothetical protein LBV75_01455 [Paludibacter sp.]|jgi:hypothetical protein|nr:hypothetical protein [Paludibacter sp.]